MIVLDTQPHLSDLKALIRQVVEFPIYAAELVDLAEREDFPIEVIDFYRAFPEDEVFEDREDLLTRTEQVDMLHHQDAPEEELLPQED